MEPDSPIPQTRAECILKVARQASGYHALIVHADADHPTADRAMNERISPGFDLVFKEKDEGDVCSQLVPIIPIRMTEAMLADIEALQRVIGTELDADGMGVPKKHREIEADADPKQRLREAIKKVQTIVPAADAVG
ncbi:hypothetical protein QUF72_04385 [Desulfobacterales bacterium HSG2]|nr:hypothetical protein [Desulfobacterales bacterium HSG2]